MVRLREGGLRAHPRHQPIGGRLVRPVQPAAVLLGAGETRPAPDRLPGVSLTDPFRRLTNYVP